MAKKSKIYLNFPISLVPPIYKAKDCHGAMNEIISYGIVAYAEGRKIGYAEALDEMGITSTRSFEEQRAIHDKVPKSSVYTSLDKDRAFYFRDGRFSYKANKDDIMALCGELAIRSIVGKKEYAHCYRGFVLSRMAGFAKVISEELYPEAVSRLSGDGGRRQWRKMIASLKYAGCSVYSPSGAHGFYASFKLSPVELAKAVERKKRLINKRNTEYDLSNEELQKIALAEIDKEESVPL